MEDASTARLKSLITNGNDALEFKLVRDVKDLEDDACSFKPEMSHQVFGDSESIFGYRDLKIKLFYSAGSLETYLGMTYTERVNKKTCEGVEADPVLLKISEKLAPRIHDNLDSFVASLRKDDDFRPHGDLSYSFSIDDNGAARQFEVYKADMSFKGFEDYHQRLRTFLLWYIDAANFVDVDDDQWDYFNVFERYTSAAGVTRYAAAGFATVYRYYAYPRHTRPRIAQVLILPPFQNLGLGAQLLCAIYREYVGRSDVKDITVEDPSVAFQRLRDYVDAINCRTLPSFARDCLMRGFDKTMAAEAREKFKINRKQARRIYEILRLLETDLSNPLEYREYRLNVKRRLNVPYKREQQDLEKLEAALKSLEKGANNITFPPAEQRMQTLEKEYRALEEEYKKVIKRIQEAPEL